MAGPASDPSPRTVTIAVVQRRPVQRRASFLGALSVAVAVVVGGCAEAPSNDELVRALEASGIPTAQAECAAGAVLTELSSEEVVQLMQRGPGGAPRDDPDSTDDSSDRVRAALAECQAMGISTTTTTTTTTTEAQSDTSDDGQPG